MNILSFFAHPDDETMLAGGLFAMLAKRGAKLNFLCATRGEGGETGEPPLCPQEDLGQIREQELRSAVEALAPGSDLEFMDYIDPLVGPKDSLYAFMEDPIRLANELESHLKKKNIDLIISHGSNGEYGHPAHILCHNAAKMAVERLERIPLFFSVQAKYPEHPKPRLANQDDMATIILDLQDVWPIKVQAALCHQSQNALFVRRESERQNRQVPVAEIVLSTESYHQVFSENKSNQQIYNQLLMLLDRHSLK